MWYYKGKEFKSEMIGDSIGFVYIISDLKNNKKYIGQKKLSAIKRLPPLKGKTRKRVVTKESDWSSYYGSNEELKILVTELGPEWFHREIIHLCSSKGEMNWLELREQVLTECLLKPDEYYNSFVGGRINRTHLKSLWKT